jgi:hypothetical protein
MRPKTKPIAVAIALLFAAQSAWADGFTITPGENRVMFHLRMPDYNTSFSATNGTFDSVVASDTYVVFDRYVLSLKPIGAGGVAVDVLDASANLTLGVSSSSGGVLWALGGFAPQTNVSVYDDGVIYDVFESNSSGVISFTNSPSGVYVFEENATMAPTTTTTLESGGGGRRVSTTTTSLEPSTSTVSTTSSTVSTLRSPASTLPSTGTTSPPSAPDRPEDAPEGVTATTVGGQAEIVHPPATQEASTRPSAGTPKTLAFYAIIFAVGMAMVVSLSAVGILLLGRKPPKPRGSRLGSV